MANVANNVLEAGASNSKRLQRASNGYLFAVWKNSSGSISVHKSTNDGAGWTVEHTVSAASHPTIHINSKDEIHLAYIKSDKLYHKWAKKDVSGTSWTWKTETQVYNGTTSAYPDIVSFPQGTATSVNIVFQRKYTTTTDGGGYYNYEWSYDYGLGVGAISQTLCENYAVTEHGHSDSGTRWSTSNSSCPAPSSYTHTHVVYDDLCWPFQIKHTHARTSCSIVRQVWHDNADITNYYGYAMHSRLTVASDESITVNGTFTISSNAGNVSKMFPSIDFHHTGDGKTVKDNSPHLFAAWSGPNTSYGLRFKKGLYGSGTWDWSVERKLDAGRYVNGDPGWAACRFDGTGVITIGWLNDGSGYRDLTLYERDVSDSLTQTKLLVSNAASSDATDYGSFSYDDNRNLYISGKYNDGSNKVGYRKWTRANNLLDAAITSVASVLTAGSYSNFKPGYSSDSIELIYNNGSVLTYQEPVALNSPPDTPALTNPVGSSTVDRTLPVKFTWTFSDPNDGDYQTKYEGRHRIVGTNTWTTWSATTTTTAKDFAASYFGAGNYEWQIRYADKAGAWSNWSDLAFFTAATPPTGPTITHPSQGATIPSSNGRVDWSYPSQESYQVRRVADSNGSADTSTVYSDTGEVVDTIKRTQSLTFDTTGRYEHVQVRIKDQTLWSAWSSIRVLVSFTPSPTPTFTANPNYSTATINIVVTNPVPTGSQPALEENVIYRREWGTDDFEVMGTIPQNGTYIDYTAPSHVTLVYRVEAKGVNGTSTFSSDEQVSYKLTDWWLKDVSDPINNMTIFVDNDPLSLASNEEVAFFEPLGRSDVYWVADTIRSREGTLSIQFANDEDFIKFVSLRSLQKPLLLQGPMRGIQMFVKFGPTMRDDIHNTNDPYRTVNMPFKEVYNA